MNKINGFQFKPLLVGLTLFGIPYLLPGVALARPPLGVLTSEGSVAQLKADGARYQQTGFQTLAEESYREALELEDRANLLPPERDADVPFNLGLIYTQQGKLVEARNVFQRAYDADPSNFQIVYHLGITELRLGNQAQARTHLTRLELAAAEDPEMKQHLGSLIALLDPAPGQDLNNHNFAGTAETSDAEASSGSPEALSPAAASLLPPAAPQTVEFTPPTDAAQPVTVPEPPGALQQIRNRRD